MMPPVDHHAEAVALVVAACRIAEHVQDDRISAATGARQIRILALAAEAHLRMAAPAPDTTPDQGETR